MYYMHMCSADGSTHTESNKLYRKVKYRYHTNLYPRQRPTAKSRHDQAALAASAEARGATHRARPRTEKFVPRAPRVNPDLIDDGLSRARPSSPSSFRVLVRIDPLQISISG